MEDAGPLERARENLTGLVSILVTGFWLGAMFTGQEWWLAALLVGYIVVVPTVALLFGDEEDVEEYWHEDVDTSTEKSGEAAHEEGEREESTDDALQTLRDRYARGELTEDQFERKLKRLLETETLEDVEERYGGRRREPERES